MTKKKELLTPKETKKIKEYSKEYYEKNKDKVNKKCRDYHKRKRTKRLEYMKKWRTKNKKHTKEYYGKHRDRITQYNKEWREKNKDWTKENRKKNYNKHKSEIRYYAYYHLRKPIIKERKKCEKCGSIIKLETHHKKYTKNPEDILLLCKSCHNKILQNGYNTQNRLSKYPLNVSSNNK